jgi:hypothetical protein
LLDSLSGVLGTQPLETNLLEGSGVWAVSWDSNALLLTVQCCPPPGATGAAGLPKAATNRTHSSGGIAFNYYVPGHQPPANTPVFPEDKPLVVVTALRTMFV